MKIEKKWYIVRMLTGYEMSFQRNQRTPLNHQTGSLSKHSGHYYNQPTWVPWLGAPTWLQAMSFKSNRHKAVYIAPYHCAWFTVKSQKKQDHQLSSSHGNKINLSYMIWWINMNGHVLIIMVPIHTIDTKQVRQPDNLNGKQYDKVPSTKRICIWIPIISLS